MLKWSVWQIKLADVDSTSFDDPKAGDCKHPVHQSDHEMVPNGIQPKATTTTKNAGLNILHIKSVCSNDEKKKIVSSNGVSAFYLEWTLCHFKKMWSK